MVGPVIFDTIKRYLTYCGYEVTLVVNITMSMTKLIGQQHERGIPMSQIAEEMTIDYLNTCGHSASIKSTTCRSD